MSLKAEKKIMNHQTQHLLITNNFIVYIMFYHGLMRLFVIVAFVVAGSVMVSAQRFETHKVCLSDNGDIKNIKINFAEPHQTLH